MPLLERLLGRRNSEKAYAAAAPVKVSPRLYDPVSGSVVFNELDYLGVETVENVYLKNPNRSCTGKGPELVSDVVCKLLKPTLSQTPLRKLNFSISDKGVRLDDTRTSVVVEDATYATIPYCGGHPVLTKLFCFICEDLDAEDPTLKVHVLNAGSENVVMQMVKTLTNACGYAHRSRMAKTTRDKQLNAIEPSSWHARSTLTRSATADSLTTTACPKPVQQPAKLGHGSTPPEEDEDNDGMGGLDEVKRNVDARGARSGLAGSRSLPNVQLHQTMSMPRIPMPPNHR